MRLGSETAMWSVWPPHVGETIAKERGSLTQARRVQTEHKVETGWIVHHGDKEA